MTARLHADADPTRWVPVTGRGLRGGRQRRAAVRMLLGSAGIERDMPGSGVLAFLANRAASAMVRGAQGTLLLWGWREDPDLVTALAQVQELTPQVRAARAMMPMSFDDTESFSSPYLGVGERAIVDDPSRGSRLLTAHYSWDTGAHLVTLQAASADRERFGTVHPALDDLARSLRIDEDFTVSADNVLRLPPG